MTSNAPVLSASNKTSVLAIPDRREDRAVQQQYASAIVDCVSSSGLRMVSDR